MNKIILWGIGGVIVGIIISSLFSSVAPFRSMMGGFNSPSDRISGRNTRTINNIDQHFIEQMIPHHDGAIAMANLALLKATRPEIKILARAIINAQEKEIKEMRGWYKDWFRKDVSTQNTFSMMSGGMMSQGGMHMGGQEDIQILENADDFDKAFIENMIPHHQLAIMMAQMLRSGTNRSEMLSLADNIIESQSREIKEMQGWYKLYETKI